MYKETGNEGQGTGSPSLLSGKRSLFWGSFLGLLVVDQLVKAWVRLNMNEGQSLSLPFPGVFEIERAANTGVAFGAFEGKGVLLTPIAIAIAIASVVYIYRHPKESRWNHAAFGLLASGAIGNLIDRLFLHGKVTDMFYFRLIQFPIFNVADSCITVATIMLMIGWWREGVAKERKGVKELGSQAAEGDGVS